MPNAVLTISGLAPVDLNYCLKFKYYNYNHNWTNWAHCVRELSSYGAFVLMEVTGNIKACIL